MPRKKKNKQNRPPDVVTPDGEGFPLDISPGNTEDIQLAARAIQEEWPIKPQWRGKLIRRLMHDVLGRSTNAKERATAAKAILEANRQNLMARQAENKKESETNVNVNVGLGVQLYWPANGSEAPEYLSATGIHTSNGNGRNGDGNGNGQH